MTCSTCGHTLGWECECPENAYPQPDDDAKAKDERLENKYLRRYDAKG